MPTSSNRANVSVNKTTCVRKLMIGTTKPPSGTTKEARGVAHTTADAATVDHQGQAEGDPPDAQSQPVQTETLPAILE